MKSFMPNIKASSKVGLPKKCQQALCLTLCLILVLLAVATKPAGGAEETKPLVAILPVAQGEDSQKASSWLSTTLSQGLVYNFRKLSSIKLADSKDVSEAIKAQKVKSGQLLDDRQVSEVGLHLKADLVVSTTYQVGEDEMALLEVRLIEPKSKSVKDSFSYKANTDRLLGTLATVTTRTASSMDYPVSSQERRSIKTPPTSSLRAFHDFQRALAAYDPVLGTGNLSESVALLTNAINRDPHYDEARFQLSLLSARQGKSDQAASHLQKLIEDNATYPNVQHNLGLAKLNQGDYAAARRELQKAYQVHPQDVNILNDLALAEYYLKHYESAQKYLSTASELESTSYVVWNNMGTVAYTRGEFTEAQQAYSKAIQQNSRSISSHYNLGLTYLQLAEINNAKQAFEKTLELDPRHAKSYYCLALIAEGDGTGKAESYWKKYLELAKEEPVEQSFVAFAKNMLARQASEQHQP